MREQTFRQQILRPTLSSARCSGLNYPLLIKTSRGRRSRRQSSFLNELFNLRPWHAPFERPTPPRPPSRLPLGKNFSVRL